MPKIECDDKTAMERIIITFKSEELHQYDWGRAQGYNCNSSEKRAKFMGMTMEEYMRYLWNNPQNGQSPYKLFEGAIVPDGKDVNGNIIYRYNGAKF